MSMNNNNDQNDQNPPNSSLQQGNGSSSNMCYALIGASQNNNNHHQQPLYNSSNNQAHQMMGVQSLSQQLSSGNNKKEKRQQQQRDNCNNKVIGGAGQAQQAMTSDDLLRPVNDYDEARMNRVKQMMAKLGYSEKVGDLVQLFTYVIPQNLKIIRRTKPWMDHHMTLQCIRCDSALSPHPMNNICMNCKRSCCHPCFQKWTSHVEAMEHAFPCLCNDVRLQRIVGVGDLMTLFKQLKIQCPNENCSYVELYDKFYRGYDSNRNLLQYHHAQHQHQHMYHQQNYHNFLNDEGQYGLGSWPLPDSHFFICPHKPIKCNRCCQTVSEKDMQKHRQDCRSAENGDEVTTTNMVDEGAEGQGDCQNNQTVMGAAAVMNLNAPPNASSNAMATPIDSRELLLQEHKAAENQIALERQQQQNLLQQQKSSSPYEESKYGSGAKPPQSKKVGYPAPNDNDELKALLSRESQEDEDEEEDGESEQDEENDLENEFGSSPQVVNIQLQQQQQQKFQLANNGSSSNSRPPVMPTYDQLYKWWFENVVVAQKQQHMPHQQHAAQHHQVISRKRRLKTQQKNLKKCTTAATMMMIQQKKLQQQAPSSPLQTIVNKHEAATDAAAQLKCILCTKVENPLIQPPQASMNNDGGAAETSQLLNRIVGICVNCITQKPTHLQQLQHQQQQLSQPIITAGEDEESFHCYRLGCCPKCRTQVKASFTCGCHSHEIERKEWTFPPASQHHQNQKVEAPVEPQNCQNPIEIFENLNRGVIDNNKKEV